MFQIENFTQDSISFLENIKDDDMQSKERVSKNMFFFHFQWGVSLAIIAFQYFYKKKPLKIMPKHVLHFYIRFYRVFFIVPPDFQYHNEKTSSQ